MDDSGEVLVQGDFPNETKGYDSLLAKTGEEVKVAFEATYAWGYVYEELEDRVEEVKLAHEEDEEKFIEGWNRVLEGKLEEIVVRIKTKGGDTRWLKVGGRPILEDGEVVEIQYAGQDITELKEAEDQVRLERERFEELFKGANELIVTTDGEGYIKRVNRRTLEQSGYSEDELVGESVLKVAHPEDKEKFIEFWEEIIEEKEEVEKTVRVVGKSGSVAWTRSGGRPILKDGEIVEVQYTSQDITDLVKTRRREKFLHSLLRHNLRNKISIIDGYNDLLQDTDLSDEQEKFVQKAGKATRDSADLIEKVRTLRRIGEEEKEEIDLDPLIREAVESCKSTGPEMDFQIVMECPMEGCKVKGGPLLEELFSNLLENSVRHSGGSKVRISNRETDGEMICIVEDNGKGIPHEEKEDIFERGYKDDKSVGSGLGMYLVKEIANRYGGSVEVKDSELGGARFDVHLKKA